MTNYALDHKRAIFAIKANNLINRFNGKLKNTKRAAIHRNFV